MSKFLYSVRHLFKPICITRETYRPERYAISNDSEHYNSEDYLASQSVWCIAITTGIPIDDVAQRLFASMERDEMYITTHPENLPYIKEDMRR